MLKGELLKHLNDPVCLSSRRNRKVEIRIRGTLPLDTIRKGRSTLDRPKTKKHEGFWGNAFRSLYQRRSIAVAESF